MGYFRWPLLVCLGIASESALAGLCDVAWDGEKITSAIAGRSASFMVPLRSKQYGTQPVAAGDIQAFSTAVHRVSPVAGLSPKYLICNSEDPNAFATQGKDGPVVGVTIGMMKLVGGDSDMAAAVLGHELAHHTQHHADQAATQQAIVGIVGLVAGALLDVKLQRQHHTQPGLGLDLANLGGALVSRKFSRDQEREADEVGFKYMVAASFNPNGAIRMAEKMNSAGTGGLGLFWDTHPGWPERAERFREFLAADPRAQELANAGPTVVAVSTERQSGPAHIELLATYVTTDAQKSYNDGLAALRQRDSALALRELRSAAEGGYAPAQALVGYWYLNGLQGLPKIEGEGIRLLKLATEQGDALGQANLGFVYSSGRGVARDDTEAIRLFRLSADQHNPLGMTNLGFFYLVGRGGLSKDEPKALELFRAAADQGNSLAQANLGAMYENGQGGLSKSDVEAVRYYKMAVERGNGLGQANLGYMYWMGRGGLRRDLPEAVRLFRLSALQGYALGQNNLGAAYENGIGGLRRDRTEAITWYKKAAAQGHALAMANLKRLGESQ